jgi:hypothetical protein
MFLFVNLINVIIYNYLKAIPRFIKDPNPIFSGYFRIKFSKIIENVVDKFCSAFLERKMEQNTSIYRMFHSLLLFFNYNSNFFFID